MTKFRKFAIALALAPAACFAEGEATTNTMETIIHDVQTALTTLIGQIVTAVGAIVVAGLVFWGLKALVRWARSYFGK